MATEHRTPIICPYCGSIENNGHICFWCRNPVTEYESEENTMTIEMKFTGLSPETALKLLKAAAETSADGTTTVTPTAAVPQTAPVPQTTPAPQTTLVQPPVAPAAVNPAVGVPCAATQPPIAPPVPAAAAPQPPTAPTTAVPAAAPTYTLEALARAGAALAQAGKRQDAVNLLAKYGVQSVNQLKPEQYGAFATELRALGAQI